MSSSATHASEILLRTSGDARVPERLYDQMLDSDSNLVLIESPFADDLMAYLRQMAQRRGHSIYAWDTEGGLASLREHGITVAGSKRLSEALRFVLQSGHFGVYIFPADSGELTPQVLALMRQFGEFRPCTTVQMNTSFLRPLTGQDALVHARVLRAGRSLAFGEIDIAGARDGKSVCRASVTYALL